jgi:dipeptidyl aminopeptidase/acylaminoacyl peptidase
MPRLAITLPLLITPIVIAAQEPQGSAGASARKTPIPSADWSRFEVLGASVISADGTWVAYELRRNGGFGASELHYRALSADKDEIATAASGATFSSNSRWLVYTIVDSAAAGRGGGRGGAGAAAAPTVRNKVGVVDLRRGTTTVIADVQSFALSKDGNFVALRRYTAPAPAGGRAPRGADVVVRDLEKGTDLTIGNVAELAWSDALGSALLALAIDADGGAGSGVQLLDATTGALRSLDNANQRYAQLTWRPRSTDLAVLRSRSDSAFVDTAYTVLAWRGLATGRSGALHYEADSDSGFPRGMRVASYRRPVWSDDGAHLFFGIARREPKPAPSARNGQAPPAPARVEIWHWRDARQYHQQNRQSQQDRERTQLVVWTPGKARIVRLADDSLDAVQLSETESLAIAADDKPYFKEAVSGRPYRDYYTIDLATGARRKALTKIAYQPAISPSGRYLVYAQEGHVWSYDVASGSRASLTSRLASSFVDTDDDHPVPERRPYGVGGWTTGEGTVLLYDKFDVWQVKLDGSSPVRLTRGREDSTVYRVRDLDPDVRTIDPRKPVYLTAAGEWNKKSGFSRLLLGEPAQRLVWLDKNLSRLDKAKDAEVFSYVAQSFDESPNLFVAGPTLGDAKRVSSTNSFLADYAWGKQVLMDYKNSRGEKLQMMLTYPADYQPGRRYPMVVYYYEKLSQGFHQFVVPTNRATYNTSVFSQNGYFVLRPDVVFRYRDPGMSGLDCVTSAVRTAIATGMIDSAHVGNMGHSWGGYQSAFYAVHGKKMFAATIAGAPLTNLVSMYGYTSYNTGLPETGHFETGQERMEVPLWEDPQAYIRNSTVFAVDSLETPLLLQGGDADGNVNYWQSMELYNFGRRLGKKVVLLLYNEENHGVARPESQMDYHRRQLEWFDHYLKGAPAAEWIEKGETYLTRQKLIREAANAATEGSGAPQAPNPTAGGSAGRARNP